MHGKLTFDCGKIRGEMVRLNSEISPRGAPKHEGAGGKRHTEGRVDMRCLSVCVVERSGLCEGPCDVQPRCAVFSSAADMLFNCGAEVRYCLRVLGTLRSLTPTP